MQLTSPQLTSWLSSVFDDEIVKIIFSNPTPSNVYKKTEALKKDNDFLISNYTDKQVFNKHVSFWDCINFTSEQLKKYKQCNLFSPQY